VSKKKYAEASFVLKHLIREFPDIVIVQRIGEQVLQTGDLADTTISIGNKDVYRYCKVEQIFPENNTFQYHLQWFTISLEDKQSTLQKHEFDLIFPPRGTHSGANFNRLISHNVLVNKMRPLTKLECDEFKEILTSTNFWSLPNLFGAFAVPELHKTRLIEARRKTKYRNMNQKKHIGTIAKNSAANATLFKLLEQFISTKTL
jgi:hypothetical protein